MFRCVGSKHPSIQEWKYISHTKKIVQFQIFLKQYVHLTWRQGLQSCWNIDICVPAFNHWMITNADWGQMRGSCYQISEQPSDYRKMERGKPDLSASLEKFFWEFLDALAPLHFKLAVISGSYFLMLWLYSASLRFSSLFLFFLFGPQLFCFLYITCHVTFTRHFVWPWMLDKNNLSYWPVLNRGDVLNFLDGNARSFQPQRCLNSFQLFTLARGLTCAPISWSPNSTYFHFAILFVCQHTIENAVQCHSWLSGNKDCF